MTEGLAEGAPRTEGVEPQRMFTVAQLVDGDALCYCGAEAVLVVDSEPDREPGAVCYQHGKEWIDVTVAFLAQLFGPKEATT